MLSRLHKWDKLNHFQDIYFSEDIFCNFYVIFLLLIFRWFWQQIEVFLFLAIKFFFRTCKYFLVCHSKFPKASKHTQKKFFLGFPLYLFKRTFWKIFLKFFLNICVTESALSSTICNWFWILQFIWEDKISVIYF